MLTLALARRLEGSGVTRGLPRPGRRGHRDAGERVARAPRHPGRGRRRDQRVPGVGAGRRRRLRRLLRRRRRRPRRWRRPSTSLRRSASGPRSRPSPVRSAPRIRPPPAARPPCSSGYKRYGTAPHTTARRRPRAEDDDEHTTSDGLLAHDLRLEPQGQGVLQAARHQGVRHRIRHCRPRPAAARSTRRCSKERADGFPFVRIGGRVVKGYDPATYDRLLRGA